MNIFRYTIKSLLSLSRSERWGLVVLFLLILFFVFYPHLQPTPPAPDYEELKAYMQRIDSLNAFVETANSTEKAPSSRNYASHREPFNKPEAKHELFVFDPNTADSTAFHRLGFSPKQSAAIVRYRTSGAKFRTPDDFSKVYVVDAKMFERLKPYIAIVLDNDKLPVAPPTKEVTRKSSVKVELNIADTAELNTVRGIGSYFAKAIVEQRTRLGGFTHIEQLLDIRGMNEERLQSLAPQLTIDQSLVRKIKLQTADEQTLKNHPYIGAYAARGILLFRKNNARCTLDDLLVNNVLSRQQAEKLTGYVVEE